MKSALIIILAILIIINIGSFIYGKLCLKKLDKSNENADENYKKGIKYVVFSVILSFFTIIAITVLVLINLLAK